MTAAEQPMSERDAAVAAAREIHTSELQAALSLRLSGLEQVEEQYRTATGMANLVYQQTMADIESEYGDGVSAR